MLCSRLFDPAGLGCELGEPRSSHSLSRMYDDPAYLGGELGEPPPSRCLSWKPDADSDEGRMQLYSLESQLATGNPPVKPYLSGSSPDRRLFFLVKLSAISHF